MTSKSADELLIVLTCWTHYNGELVTVAKHISDELGKPFADARQGDLIDGVFRRRVDLASGRFALIEKVREFSLVPWRPVLERHVGKSVAGVVRESGVSWTIGRGRSGLSIG